jgi:glycosyltransferase involved in cell wall biosynthesis
MQRLPSFACRVVVVHGFLDEQDYGELIRRTDFYVNVSKAEGLCIPLMEFMSCGKPALAPRHTSLLDYLDDSNSIAIDATTEPCIWPHDERAVLRTLQYRVSWESTVAAFRRSFSVYHEDPESYRRMGAAAAEAMERYCGIDCVTSGIGAFLDAALPKAAVMQRGATAQQAGGDE